MRGHETRGDPVPRDGPSHLLWRPNCDNEIPVIPLCTELQFGVFLNTKICCFWAERLKFNTNSSVQQMQHKFQLRLLSRYPDFCTHTLHYTVCQFIIIEALLSPFEVKGLWGQTWPTNLLCPFSRYMSVSPVQYSTDPESDLQICIVVTWF